MKAIVNTNVVLPDSIIWDGAVLIEGERIAAVGERSEIAIPADAEIIDAGGKYTAPGFVDIHNHGCNGKWTEQDPAMIAEENLKNGTTTLLGTLFYNLTMEEYLAGIAAVKEASKKGAGRIYGGLYMEGPFMNAKYGADARNNKWKHPLDPAEYERLADAAGDFVRVWCVAPEREHIEDFCAYARSVNPKVRFSAGHCEAKPYMVYALKQYGLVNQTHHMNATGIVNPFAPNGVPSGIRDCGPDEATLYDDDIYAELIVDNLGIHVKPHNLRMVQKIKGNDKLILITDACPVGNPPPKGSDYEKASDLGFDEDGGLCGSKMTMPMACRNMIKHTGSGLAQIFKYAALNPATMLGMQYEIGSVTPGKRANLIVIDDKINIDRIFFMGETVK